MGCESGYYFTCKMYTSSGDSNIRTSIIRIREYPNWQSRSNIFVHTYVRKFVVDFKLQQRYNDMDDAEDNLSFQY